MRNKLLLVGCLGLVALLGMTPLARADGGRFSFGFNFGRPAYYGPYSYYTLHPGYYAPSYLPPVYTSGVYYPGTRLGIRHYTPYRYRVYRSYIPRYRRYYGGYAPYAPRRYYRRTLYRW